MLIFALVAMADHHDEMKKVSAETKAEHQTISGTLVCLGCSLKADGAHSECSAFGHTHALKTEDGHFINFLENKFAADLIKGEKYHNKQVKVSGVFFAKANLLDVESFTVDDQKKGWCDHCNAMDGCSMAGK